MKLTNIENAKSFFDTFKCEHISTENIQEVKQKFQAPTYGENLTKYLKMHALNDDIENEEKVYIVKNKNNQIVFYFSLKCGLLCKPKKFPTLTEEQEELVLTVFDALKNNNRDLLSEYKQSDLFKNCWDEIFSIAKNKLDAIEDTTKDNGRSMSVYEVHPAIELSHFCKNGNLANYPIDIPMGFGVFWQKIVPIIIDISKTIGCKFLYLFAANIEKSPYTNSKGHTNDLISYYRDSLNFRDAQELVMIKPRYDRNCHPMLQRITALQEAQNNIWERFEDVINGI